MSSKPYNPLHKHNLAVSVTMALLERSLHPLPPEEFEGAGIYAIYYYGEDQLYKDISLKMKKSVQIPIYVGKAVPAGARKGITTESQKVTRVLYKRIQEHYKSIESTNNLNVNDFQCRYLIVDDIWIPLGESVMINKYKPLWNIIVEGFGNHDPGSGRRNQKRSAWDELHPGRSWAEKLPPAQQTIEDLKTEIATYTETIIDHVQNFDMPIAD